MYLKTGNLLVGAEKISMSTQKFAEKFPEALGVLWPRQKRL
jgi:hypothetical protein